MMQKGLQKREIKLINHFNISVLFLSMAPLVNSANLTRLILLFSGIALILIGFYGIGEDFLHNWRIEEYSSLAALLSGAAILLATTLVYVVIPEYDYRRRMEVLRQFYMGEREGDLKALKHNIIERSQGIMTGTEILAGNIRECIVEDMPIEQCKNHILEARMMLDQVNAESSKLKEFLDKLDDYISAKKPTADK